MKNTFTNLMFLLVIAATSISLCSAQEVVTVEDPITHNSYIYPTQDGQAGTVTGEHNDNDGDWETYVQITSDGNHTWGIVWYDEEEWVIPENTLTAYFNIKIEAPDPYVFQGNHYLSFWNYSQNIWDTEEVGGSYSGSTPEPLSGMTFINYELSSDWISESGDIMSRVTIVQKHNTGAWSRLYETSLTYVSEPAVVETEILFDNFDDGNIDDWSAIHPHTGIPTTLPDIVTSPQGYSLRGVGSGYSHDPGLNVWLSRPLSLSNADQLKVEMRAKSGSSWPNSARITLMSGTDSYTFSDYGEGNQWAQFTPNVDGQKEWHNYPINANIWHDFAWTRDADGWWSLNIDGGPVEWPDFCQDNRLTDFDNIVLATLRNQSEIEWVRISVPCEPDISLLPESYDFGNVEIGTSTTSIVTITNEGNADLIIDTIAVYNDLSNSFDITTTPSLPTSIMPSSTIDVELSFMPSIEDYVSSVLQITSNDSDEPLIEMSLSGVGIRVDIPPSEQIQNIITYVDQAVADGFLMGVGPGKSSDKKLNALRNMIKAAGDLIDDGFYEEAYEQLQSLYKKCDGQTPPPDFVAGLAVAELAELIQELMATITGE